jgi:YD repeat-containing protein
MTRGQWRPVLLALVLLSVSLATATSTALADSVTYTYDSLGRLVKLTYDNGATMVYNYDSAGNRTSVVVTAVAGGIFHGHVSLPGRPTPPDPTWVIPLQVSFLVPGTSTVVFSATPLTDASGNFSVGNLPPGTYDVQIKFASALSKLARNQVVLVGDNPVHDFGALAMGDVNNDDVVDALDFSSLRATFGKCAGDAGYDARAELNGDGCVDALDFSLLRPNFGKFGPQPG